MTTVYLLAGFLALASLAGRRHLSTSAWVRRAPGWGIVAWQALTASVAAGLVLLGLTLAAPLPQLAWIVAAVVGTTPADVVAHYPAPFGVLGAYAAAVFTGLLVLRLVGSGLGALAGSWRVRRSQAQALRLVGQPHPDGYVLIDHPHPVVYCLPGRRPVIVVSRSACDLLSADELRLVLAHERSHLHARHDRSLGWIRALHEAFGPVGLGVFATAAAQVETLIEMQADDAASDRRGLARALVTLGTAPVPSGPGALGAGDVAAVERVRRLAADQGTWRRRQSAGVVVATAGVLLTPVAGALIPVGEMLLAGCLS